jgi:hypothetical protein
MAASRASQRPGSSRKCPANTDFCSKSVASLGLRIWLAVVPVSREPVSGSEFPASREINSDSRPFAGCLKVRNAKFSHNGCLTSKIRPTQNRELERPEQRSKCQEQRLEISEAGTGESTRPQVLLRRPQPLAVKAEQAVPGRHRPSASSKHHAPVNCLRRAKRVLPAALAGQWSRPINPLTVPLARADGRPPDVVRLQGS